MSRSTQPCRCGRAWVARWYRKNAGYARVCPACGNFTRLCRCQPLEVPERSAEKVFLSDYEKHGAFEWRSKSRTTTEGR